MDKILKQYKKNTYDYISNTLNPTFPDGLDVEVFNFKTLEYAWRESKNKLDREHVTKYIINSTKFKKKNFSFKKNLSSLRLTVDEKIDLLQIEKIYSKLKKKKFFGIEDIYKLYNSQYFC